MYYVLTTVILWLAFAFATASIAHNKGRSAPGWAVAGLAFGVFALLAVALVSNLTDDQPFHPLNGPKTYIYLPPEGMEPVRTANRSLPALIGAGVIALVTGSLFSRRAR